MTTEHKCSQPDCSGEATRYCFTCVEYFCTEHLCSHLNGFDYPVGRSWLSNDAVLERITDDELARIRATLSMQLAAVDRELFDRKFDSYKRTGKIPTLRVDDLSDRRTKRRTRKPDGRPKTTITKQAQDFGDALRNLKPETLKRVQDALRKRGL